MTGKRIETAALVGLCLALYAVYVEHKNEEDSSYEALCDISDRMSCSRVLMSEWGHILSQLGILTKGHPLDLANSTYGAIFYVLVCFHRLLPLLSHRAKVKLIFVLSILVAVVSLYMAYILFFMLQDVCLVCMSIYAVNATILTLAYKALSSGGNGSGGGEKRAANSPVDTDDLAEMKKNS